MLYLNIRIGQDIRGSGDKGGGRGSLEMLSDVGKAQGNYAEKDNGSGQKNNKSVV